MNSDSPKFSLNSIDWSKIGVGAAVAVGGALATYITSFVSSTDFGTYTPVIVALWSVVLNLVRKYLTDNTAQG